MARRRHRSELKSAVWTGPLSHLITAATLSERHDAMSVPPLRKGDRGRRTQMGRNSIAKRRLSTFVLATTQWMLGRLGGSRLVFYSNPKVSRLVVHEERTCQASFVKEVSANVRSLMSSDPSRAHSTWGHEAREVISSLNYHSPPHNQNHNCFTKVNSVCHESSIERKSSARRIVPCFDTAKCHCDRPRGASTAGRRR